jgi:hypothetical protein
MNIELSKRAVACRKWRWLPGMLCTTAGYRKENGALPDLEDAATLGCLLALVREAKQCPEWQPYVAYYGGEAFWWLEQPSRFRQTSHESYASVLVAALESVNGD